MTSGLFALLGPAPQSGPQQWLTVLRSPSDPELWAAYALTPCGGVGPRCSDFLPSREGAETLARALGVLADPFDEAA